MSTLTGWVAPTGSISPDCSARSSLTCASGGSSPTSSRNSVPPLASWNLPVRRDVAPVNEPFSWPNRMDSTSCAGRAPQLTATNGLPARSDEPWIARAKTSLPVPDSPSIRMGMSERAARRASAMAARVVLGGGDELVEGKPVLLAPRQRAGPRSRDRRWRARCGSRRRGAPVPTGLIRKSVAPARIASTARLTDPSAVSTSTGDPDLGAAQPPDDLQPVEIGHVQIEQHQIGPRGRVRPSAYRARRARHRPPSPRTRRRTAPPIGIGAAVRRRRQSELVQPLDSSLGACFGCAGSKRISVDNPSPCPRSRTTPARQVSAGRAAARAAGRFGLRLLFMCTCNR